MPAYTGFPDLFNNTYLDSQELATGQRSILGSNPYRTLPRDCPFRISNIEIDTTKLHKGNIYFSG